MSDLAELYARNASFAEGFDLGHLPMKPNLSTLILTCVDARLAPAHFAGLRLGDALVLRNVGARVTDTVALEVAILWQLMALASGGTPSIELVVIEHTECGMARFATPEVAAKITDHFGTGAVVDTYAIVDPLESIATDIDRLRANPIVPSDLTVSGHLYDVATGRLSTVIETAPLR
jgi:carbonic anhydrase